MSILLQETISPQAYQFIAQRVYAHSRIKLGEDKQALVAGRLRKRLRQLGLDSFEAYCEFIESAKGTEEMGPLVDLISTNHTYFFREVQHLDCLRDQILGEWIPKLVRRRETFRFWSAACSSGEEPYTVAIVLAEYARKQGVFTWQIEASDISSRVLERAQQGIYPEERVKVPEPDMLPRYFQKGTGSHAGSYRVKESLRQTVKFHWLNLLQASYPVAPCQHVIFCRNVMIYFDRPTQQELVTKLSAQLAPGGYFVVGHSESLLGVDHALKTVKLGIYQKT
jgi:chemotaxis protein methyltransferase CheR